MQTLEALIILVLLVGGVSLFFVVTVSGTGPVAQLLGSHVAGVFYGVVFCAEALLLLFAKFWRNKKLHSRILYVIFITLLFTILLEFLITGWSWALSDNVVATIAAAFCWLRWKFLTEYIDPSHFTDDVDGLGTHSPPSRRY